MRRGGTMRSWDELEADLFDQRLISRVAVKEVEDGFTLEVDEVGIVLLEGFVETLQGFIFVACVRDGLSEGIW